MEALNHKKNTSTNILNKILENQHVFMVNRAMVPPAHQGSKLRFDALMSHEGEILISGS